MNLTLPGIDDGKRDLSKSQWYTPEWLAERIWSWVLERHELSSCKLRVLEPSAGRGALVRAALRSGMCERIHAIELDPRNVAILATMRDERGVLSTEHRDFLQPTRGVVSRYDVVLMNPPYESGKDVDFILHAFHWAPHVVGVFRSALVHGGDRYDRLWRHVDVLRGKWLRHRPSFGKGETGDSALSDFVVLELVLRQTPREANEDMQLTMGWW